MCELKRNCCKCTASDTADPQTEPHDTVNVCVWLPALHPLMTLLSRSAVTWRSQILEYRKQSEIHSAISIFILNPVVCVADLEKCLLPEVFSVLRCELIHLKSNKLPFLARTKTTGTSRAPSVRLENRCLVSEQSSCSTEGDGCGKCFILFFLIPLFIHSSLISPMFTSQPLPYFGRKYTGRSVFLGDRK